ncbi:MAG: hypothetical protein F6K16_36850 [Symploca sp. SIO2B6]|nr:hypothetical protein [Symploca sp. SIO2B6]
MTLQSSTIRALWAVIEDIPSQDLLTLPEPALADLLFQHLSRKSLHLSSEERAALSVYINKRVALIQDIASFRGTGELGIVAS